MRPLRLLVAAALLPAWLCLVPATGVASNRCVDEETVADLPSTPVFVEAVGTQITRSEEHTSELQSH